MARRIGYSADAGITKRAAWRLPDSKPDSLDGILTIRLPYPYMRLPSAESTFTITVTRKYPQWILSPRNAGKRWPFDVNIIRPNMPPEIRDRMFKKIIEDALNERPKPRPAIKAPPKGKSGSKEFMGIVRQRPVAKASPATQSIPAPHAHLAASCPSNAAIPLAIHVSAMTFVRKF